VLRPQDAAWWQRFEALVREGDLRGRRVLDVGSGTGALAAALAAREHAKVWGVEPSEDMLTVARQRVPRDVGLRLGSAEMLPFRDGWFERVVFSLVVHLVDRRVAFAEAARVLAPSGRVAIATFAPEHFDRFWLNRWFPSIPVIDRARFPTPDDLEAELTSSGFESVSFTRLTTERAIDRETALERIRGKHISTFDLLDEQELREGTARAEAELPDSVLSRLEHLIAVAVRLPG
jgi:ubiquinone/menaquinone biosynthesis C-methylase UbiE